MLLGILSAAPRLLGQILSAAPTPRCPGGICAREAGSESWHDVVQGLKPRRERQGWTNDVCAAMSDDERDEWESLLARCESASSRVRLPDLDAFRSWGSHIARFSFSLSPLAPGTATGG
jgi:hypothetical protein